MDIISRTQAITANLNKYFTGKLCINGHISERYTRSGGCKACIEARSQEQSDYSRWNAKQLDAEDEAKLGQRILDERGLEAWMDWMLKTAALRTEESARREADTGRFKQFVSSGGCRHRVRFQDPNGATFCKRCGTEVPDVIPTRKKVKTHF